MQVPAPFEYERATSVEHALDLLARLGPDARLLAGGHSLLPMMKLRLATPEHLIDIDALAAELGYIREADGEVRIGAMTRHRELLESDLLAQRLADLHRRRARHRRPGRPQPRDDRRRAVPGRSRRGPLGRLRGGRRARRDPRAVRRARRRDARVPPRPVRDRGRRRTRCSPRSASRCTPTRAAPTRRSSAGSATGRSAPPALPCALRGTAPSPRPGSRSPRSAPSVTSPDAEQALVGNAPSEELFAEAATLPPRQPSPVTDQRGLGRVQAPRRRGAHPARPAPGHRARARSRRRRPMQVTMIGQRRGVHARRRAAAAARALPARRAGPDRDALGLRHVQLRHVRRPDGRRAGEVLHGAGRDGVRPRDPHGRGPRARRRARPGAAGLPRGARAAVRVLHPGHDAHRPRPAGREPRPDRHGDPRGDLRPDLPLHRLRDDRAVDPLGRRASRPRSRPRRSTELDGRRRGTPASASAACSARRTRASSAARATTSTTSSCPACCTARCCAAPSRTPGSSRSTPPRRCSTRRSRRSSPARTWRRSASPGCRRCRRTCRPCSPPTRCASRARRSRSSSPRTATPRATRSS